MSRLAGQNYFKKNQGEKTPQKKKKKGEHQKKKKK